MLCLRCGIQISLFTCPIFLLHVRLEKNPKINWPQECYVTTRFVKKTRFIIIYYKISWENIITIRVDSYNLFCNKNPNGNKTFNAQ